MQKYCKFGEKASHSPKNARRITTLIPDNFFLKELPPTIFIGGNTKEKYLLKPGTGLLKNLGIITTSLRSEHPSGQEIGSVAQTKKPFLVKDILLTVRSNHIPGCVASINIYRIEGKKESFVNVLHKPIYFDVAVSNDHAIRFLTFRPISITSKLGLPSTCFSTYSQSGCAQ